MDDRRESRIPRPGVAGGSGAAKPLETSRAANMSTAVGERKRRADALDAVPEGKRQTFSAGQAGMRPTRSNTTTGGTRSLQPTTSARTGVTGGSELPSIAEASVETWEEIRDRTGQTAEDVMNKKLGFAKGTKPERKVEAFVPLLKELKALCQYQNTTIKRLEMDVEGWRQQSAVDVAKYDAERQGWEAQQGDYANKIREINMHVATLEQNNTELTNKLKETEARLAAEKDANGSLQRMCAGLEVEVMRLAKQQEENANKLKEKDEEIRSQKKYAENLQTYNTALQADLTAEKARVVEAQHSSIEMQGQLAELGGKVRSMEQLLTYEREQVVKLRDDRETATRDTATLRADLDNTRQERDRAIAEVAKAKQDLDRVRAAGGKSLETLEALNNDKATMEAQLAVQQKTIMTLRDELAVERQSRAEASASAGTRATQIAELKSEVESMRTLLADAEKRVYEGELVRRKLHNIIQDLKGNIRVYCRVRPVSSAEEADNAHDSSLSMDFPTSGDLLGRGLTLGVPSTSVAQGTQKHNFTFDRVFTPGTTQIAVFDEISELVQSALDGHKVCIFAYGQTGSGKTFTMLGNRDQPGVIPRAMKQIFENGRKLAAQGWNYTLQASMLEVYNEEIRDLLSSKKNDEKKHQVSHDTNGVTTVSELTVVDIDKPETVDQLLVQAMDKRAVGCTALNEQSSRSHMVFTMRIEGFNSETNAKASGVLNLIDLAGSERVKESGATGQRLKEAQAINKSLSALGDVIMAIANKQEHVPFRNSKLTYLLQPCLGGDAKTLMFLNVAPTREFANESLCSLRFGAKVNSCEINAPKKNVIVPRA